MEKINRIRTMDELKKALNNIPSSVLQHLSVALTDDGLSLSTGYTDKPNKEDDEWEWGDWFRRMNKKYPDLQFVTDYIQKIISSASDPDFDDDAEIEAVLPKKKIKK